MALINLRDALMSGKRTPTAKDYVQDGLIAMWDGIENAGWGVHNASSSSWKDLVGNYDLVLGSTSALIWNSDHLATDGYYCAYNTTFPHSALGQEWTCECVYQLRESGTNYKALFGTRTSQNVRNIYGLNYYSPQYSGGWNMGIGVDNGDIGISNSPTLAGLASQDRINYLVMSHHSSTKLSAGVNGTYSVTTSPGTVTTNTRGFGIGRGYGGMSGSVNNRSLKADVYALRLYNRKLSDEDIGNNYAVDRFRFNLP